MTRTTERRNWLARLQGSRSGRRWVVATFGLLAGLLYWSPALWHWNATGFGDWQQFQHQWEAGYVAIMRYGELPLWNPHHCGGVFLFGDPQAQIYSPLFWLLLPVGTTTGLKLFLVLHASIGFAGMFVYARRTLHVGPTAALFASVCWAGCGFFAWRGSGGHAAFLPFYFTPWLLMAWRRTASDLRFAAVVAAWMGLVLLEGGVYPFPFFCILLAFDGLIRIVPIRRTWNVVRAGLVTVPLIVAAAGFRLVPIIDTMRRYPRPTTGGDRLRLDEVIAMLTSREYDYAFPEHEYVWAEYGTFIGSVAAVILVLGVVPAWSRHRSLHVGAGLFGWLMMGSVTEWSPWPLLHELPMFDSLRVPSRFVVFFMFYAVLLGAVGLDRVDRLISKFRPLRLSFAAVPLLVAAQIGWGNAAVIDRWRGEPIPEMAAAGHHYLLPWSEYGRYAQFPALNVSNTGCYTGMTFRQARGLWVGPAPQARVEGRSGEILSAARTSNTMTAEATMTEAGHVTFNQTWAEGWRSSVGSLTKDRLGRIVVVLGPGEQQHLRLWYEPPTLSTALALGVLGLTLPAAWWWGVSWWRRRPRQPLSIKKPTQPKAKDVGEHPA